MFSVKCFPSSVFPSSVLRQLFSVQCFASGVFRQVFSVKYFLSNVRHFLDGGVFRSIGNFFCKGWADKRAHLGCQIPDLK